MTIPLYDFKKPVPLTNIVQQQMSGWLRTAGALAAKKWPDQLPFSLEMELQELEVGRCAEVLEELAENVCGHRVGVGATGIASLVVFPRPLLLTLVSGMIGDLPKTEPEDRTLTVVEESLWEYFLHHLLLNLWQESWTGGENMALALGAREAYPKWSRLFSPVEELVICRLSFKTSVGNHEWKWLLPRLGLLPLLGQKEISRDQVLGEAAVQTRLRELMHGIPVALTIPLGSVEIALSQLSQLRPGDVILLDQKVGNPLSALMDGKKKLRGWPGRVGMSQAFVIESFSE